MILFFYNLVLVPALLIGLPWWIFRMATTHKYRAGLPQRLGLVRAQLRRFVGGRPVIWVHAVSVGEVLAVSRLVQELDVAFPEHRVVVSTTTSTGQELARDRFDVERVFYCPLDLPWAVAAYLNALRPSLLVLAETEFWPNLLSGCSRRGIPVAVVNARVSDRSYPRYAKLRALWKPFLSRLQRVLAQSKTDAERLLRIGCSAQAVTVCGNLKFDVRAPRATEAASLLRQAAGSARILVAGSTLEGEESALLEAWPQLLKANANLVLVLAPRHPERFAAVAALLSRSGVAWQRRSEWAATQAEALPPGSILLLDTIGELASLYALASVAFVGGSLVSAGGHNPLEPAQFAVPVVMGPSFVNFRAIVDELLQAEAMRIAEPQQLAATLAELLAEPARAAEIGARAKVVFDHQAGATARSVAALKALLCK